VTRSDTSRAEAFSDAIIAIVITLLILELTPPQTGLPSGPLAGQASRQPLMEEPAAPITHHRSASGAMPTCGAVIMR